MPRGADHRRDAEHDRPLYRTFDLEDLVLVLGWVREIGERSFTADQVCDLSEVAGCRWSSKRVRRILRVGVEVGWLVGAELVRRGCWLSVLRYAVTDQAVLTLPPFRKLHNEVARDTGVDARAIRSTCREQLKRAFRRSGSP